MAKEMRGELPEFAMLDSEGTQKEIFSKERDGETFPKKRRTVEQKEAEEEAQIEAEMMKGTGSFTAEAIDQLIDEARSCAWANSSVDPEWRSEKLSAPEFEEKFEEGSSEKPPSSQQFHLKTHRLVESFLTEATTALRVGSLGQFVMDALKILEIPKVPSSCRPRSKAGNMELFPIPVPTLHPQAGHVELFLQAIVGSLNSLHSPGEFRQAPLTAVANEVTKRLRNVIERSPLMDEVLPNISFEDFFSKKGVDYSGDEVRLAQPISWQSVEASLPAEVGTLDIRDFCTGGVLHFITNIEDTLIPLEEQRVGKTPSVMVKGNDWENLSHGLVARGLCQVVPEEALYSIDGQPLLNGLFSVAKDEIREGIPVTRLIMNLKPWNSISRSLCGDVGTLPAITQMSSLYIHDDDILVTSSEDLRCFFYLFGVPQAWVKFMGFGKPVPPSLIPKGGEGRPWYTWREESYPWATSTAWASHNIYTGL